MRQRIMSSHEIYSHLDTAECNKHRVRSQIFAMQSHHDGPYLATTHHVPTALAEHDTVPHMDHWRGRPGCSVPGIDPREAGWYPSRPITVKRQELYNQLPSLSDVMSPYSSLDAYTSYPYHVRDKPVYDCTTGNCVESTPYPTHCFQGPCSVTLPVSCGCSHAQCIARR